MWMIITGSLKKLNETPRDLHNCSYVEDNYRDAKSHCISSSFYFYKTKTFKRKTRFCCFLNELFSLVEDNLCSCESRSLSCILSLQISISLFCSPSRSVAFIHFKSKKSEENSYRLAIRKHRLHIQIKVLILSLFS